MRNQSLIIVFIFAIFLSGCRANSGELELSQLDRSPESLNDLSSGIDDIGQSLDGIERLIMDLPREEEEEEISEIPQTPDQVENSEDGENRGDLDSDEESQESSAEDSQDSQASQESQEDSKSQEEIKNEKIESVWKDIETTIEEIHGSWNEYQVEGLKKGASREQLDSFEGSLNNLTHAIENNNVKQSYSDIGQCYLTLRPIFDLYEDDIMAELTNLKYNTYRAYSMGIGSDEEMDFQIFDNNDELYSRIKRKIDDESKDDLIDRLENSLSSLKKGLNEDSRRVNMIKKNIVLENIKELEE